MVFAWVRAREEGRAGAQLRLDTPRRRLWALLTVAGLSLIHI